MRKAFLSVVSLGLIMLLVGCSNPNNSVSKQTSSNTSIETTKTSSEKNSVTTTETTSESSTQSSTESLTSNNTETSASISSAVSTAENISRNYQTILDEYSTKIQSTTPSLIQDFKNEAASNTNGVDGLAAISNNKVEKLAIISNEGISKMADLHYSLSDEYSIYESWATKLTDVYTAESQKIIGEYLAYSSSQSNTPVSTPNSTTPQDSIPAEASTSTPSTSPSTTTVQNGEGPKEVAQRAGITIDQLFELNGIDPNNYFLYPGQELRIK
ncbi:LysM peptidoglycan-binding domain-containing protein [Enterococcus durans]|uniref:LysM peptidoglycan-binding domain-containing protein n=1 Tax=Enterococcus durans TaxID=53345 RepID=UPI00189D3FC1|nr:LysM peptidoglycan-binding domain-containing protein [Enterococcus durans]MDB1686330.1 LysM peptidoglycan-binding domain-containing protein [Enterococcus durans]